VTASGCSSLDLAAKQVSRDLPSWGWVLFRVSRASPPPARPFADAAPSRRNRAVSGPCGSASRGVLAPADTTTSGAPSPSRTSSRSHVRDEDRQTLVGAVLRVLAPLDGSGWLAARSRSFGPHRSPWPPTLRGLIPCRSRPWNFPSRAFPSRGAVPALAGLLLPCGFALRSPPAQRLQRLHDRFPVSRQPFAARAHPKADPGLMSRDARSSRSLVRSPRHARRRTARAVRSLPTLGSPVDDRHAHFEALLPPGVRSATTLIPGQARAARRCSHGVLALQSALHYGSGFGSSRRHAREARGLMPRAPPGAQPSRLHSAIRTPTPELASPGSVDTQSLENSAHHRQAATQLTKRLASAWYASRQPHPTP